MGVFKMFSSSSNDSNQTIFRPSPSPDNYKIINWVNIKNNLIIEIKYNDVTNYEGKKILVYKHCTIEDLIKQKLIDPHFSESTTMHSPIARLEPTHHGWLLARIIANEI